MEKTENEERRHKYVTPEILAFHGISESNRARITDWMVQVFRALKLSTHSSFFAATHIMDSYLVAKFEQRVHLGSECLYLLGLTTVLLASKFEDIEPVRMSTLLEKAGYDKFSSA